MPNAFVTDPSPTPLNVRTAPYGNIIGTLDNGQSVYINDHALDRQSRAWVYVGDSETDKPLGWVYRDYIVCKGDAWCAADNNRLNRCCWSY